jgi:hypothetical protein
MRMMVLQGRPRANWQCNVLCALGLVSIFPTIGNQLWMHQSDFSAGIIGICSLIVTAGQVSILLDVLY